MTRWKDIPEYEGYYQASRCGQIRSVDRIVETRRGHFKNLKGRILSPGDNGRYLQVQLFKQNRQKAFTVHKLITLTWIGLCPEGMEVCHGHLGKRNNSVENLRYDTNSANQLDCRLYGNSSFRPVIRSDGVEFISIAMAAEFTGCDQSSISKVCRNDSLNTCGGYGWSYLENK